MIERPRERLGVYGAAALSDVELVALVLGGGRSLELAWRVLQGVGGLSGLARASPEELSGCRGVGTARAASLAAACELARRVAARRIPYETAVATPADVASFVRGHLEGVEQEQFAVLGLDARQRVRLVRTVALGSVAAVDVHPREVFRPLVRAGMHSAIVAHNHPSGVPEPSGADVELTARLVDVGRLVGIPLLDHVIVADGGYASLAQRGLMEPRGGASP